MADRRYVLYLCTCVLVFSIAIVLGTVCIIHALSHVVCDIHIMEVHLEWQHCGFLVRQCFFFANLMNQSLNNLSLNKRDQCLT